MTTRFFPLCLAAFVLTAVAVAESPAEIRHRMESRLSDIDRLKTQKIVGETNRGFLQVVQNGNGEADRVVVAENSDRQAVYAEISQQTGTTVEAVGQARARQIATNSRPGVWLQSEAGQWYVKK